MTVTTTAAVTTTSNDVLAVGTVVRCARVVNGESIGVRKAVILGLFNEKDPSSGYGVWFYTAGPAQYGPAAKGGTVGIAFRREITVTGVIEEMPERTLRWMDRSLANCSAGYALRIKVSGLHLRKRHERLGR